MLEILKKHYQKDFIIDNNPTDDDYQWFQTDQSEIFGIHKKRLTKEETGLLTSLFTPFFIQCSNVLSPQQNSWFQYLFHNGSLPAESKENDAVRFYYFFSKQPIEDIHSFEEAIIGLVSDPIILWINDNKAVLIEQNAPAMIDMENFIQLNDTFTSDFLVDSYFYIGQLHEKNDSLSVKFQYEDEVFSTAKMSFKQQKVLSYFQSIAFLFPIYPERFPIDSLSDIFLESIQDHELTHSILIYLDCNLNVSLAAKRLYMHRNSLQYRIDKFIERSGVDIKHFKEAAAVFVMITKVQHEL
ncbi:helix-turn-helix domain-containing protein [Metabacillus arenae]|uniref:Helix-turn-helix domain-containing protein n=1 Tax=Metabacillus arenae TaxID=2771434 RepID=A0A926RYV1_9BACI|nr:helix-turn-helix domain-containing protein [Metabacillus arenae]MBD1383358.1 helix-turn-helix domain-containing protein [Metabacillus arenae]